MSTRYIDVHSKPPTAAVEAIQTILVEKSRVKMSGTAIRIDPDGLPVYGKTSASVKPGVPNPDRAVARGKI